MNGMAEHGRDTRPTGRNVVLLCAEDDDLTPPLVRIIDEGIRRGLPIEVVVLEGSDPMPGLLFARPHALFVLLRSSAVGREQARAVRDGFAAFCRPEHALWEADLEDADRSPSLVAMIEREVRGTPLVGSQGDHVARPMQSRQLFIADARDIAMSVADRRLALG